MHGIHERDVIDALLAIALIPTALFGFRVNQRAKIHRTWWAQAGGLIRQEQSAAFSTPASNLGLGLFSAAVLGLFALALSAAFRHQVASSFIWLMLWTPLVAGLIGLVCLPFVLVARWTTRAVSGLKQLR
jgi:hypothetical protein